MKDKNKIIQRSKLSDLREVHGVTVLTNLREINGQGAGAVQVDALLQCPSLPC